MLLLLKTGVRSESSSQSVNTYSAVYFVPDMVVSTGDTRTSPCPHVVYVRVMHLMGDTSEGISRGLVGISQRGGTMPPPPRKKAMVSSLNMIYDTIGR